MTRDALDLTVRDGLPEALQVLLAEFPRQGWERHPHFAGLVQFWLDRHAMFRKLTAVMLEDAEAAMDARLDPQAHLPRLSRFGGMLVSQLHGHHQIEDTHYFPVLTRIEQPLERGFAILDKDHHALDGLLARFTDAANGVLQGGAEVGPFREELLSFQRFLDRHIEDEEDLIVPVILKHGPDGLH
ncbi:hemerythrin domain-containing protein [Cognatishimia sp. F0-27]|uniref:hemerythrin domain-containing protein n=1 Tax=Cognatishimia sp. F0-27 TaxID=2816855 RepID=UPI001D0C734E|nr:hemerythrin domain-containing protein [Cognatishimia sp. F0-27]MCC1494693.1 hemerythrin domain-containing protein [Cognatishimia sp. F0-27]